MGNVANFVISYGPLYGPLRGLKHENLREISALWVTAANLCNYYGLLPWICFGTTGHCGEIGYALEATALDLLPAPWATAEKLVMPYRPLRRICFGAMDHC